MLDPIEAKFDPRAGAAQVGAKADRTVEITFQCFNGMLAHAHFRVSASRIWHAVSIYERANLAGQSAS